MLRSLLIKEIDRCPLVIFSFESSVEEEKEAGGWRSYNWSPTGWST